MGAGVASCSVHPFLWRRRGYPGIRTNRSFDIDFPQLVVQAPKLTFRRSTLPWKKRNNAESANSGREASISRCAASAPDLRLEPSRPKKGRTMVWNQSRASLIEEKIKREAGGEAGRNEA